ncbi:MAG: glutathione-disulfide reductase [Caulobacteraceae bacterium]
MARYDYDLFVIGAGSGGVRAARLAATGGAHVAVAEEYRVGGTCVVRGCIPKKFMVYASEFPHVFESATDFGWTLGEARFDWPTFLERKDLEIARLSGLYVAGLHNAGAEIIHARARLVDAHTIEVDGRTITAEKILIATGATPVLPEGVPGIEHAITSNEAFQLERLPKSILVAGGGYIAVEFAGIFNGLGVETTLVYRGPMILRGFDDDVRAHLTLEMERQGVKIVTDARHERIEKSDAGLVNVLSNGHSITAEAVMFATGRLPHTKDLGLEVAGVDVNERGAVVVDDYSKSTAASVWAVGDVTDRIALTPVAIREGAAFANTEFLGKPMRFDHQSVASAVFSQPPVGSVGLAEGQARSGGRKVKVFRSVFRPMKASFHGAQDRTLVKLVVDADTDQVLGCHMVGADAPEIIQMAAIPIRLGITKAQWDETCAVHPTSAEELVTMREPVAALYKDPS